MSDEKPLPIDNIDDVLKQEECLLEFPPMVSTDLKNSSRILVKEIKMTSNCPHQPLKQKPDMEFVYKEEEFLGLKPDEQLPSRRIDKALELGSPWAAINKSEPWWRITDKDDLAFLVAQKSLHHIENCDLPKPTQLVLVNNDTVDGNGVFQSSLGRTARTGMCDANDDSHDPSSHWRLDDKDISPRQRCYEQHASRKLHSFDRDCAENRRPESNQTTEKNNPTRGQLLEALHHSQTRARKAEMSAQKAYNEKEHVVKLLFRQASQLFACKQWIYMLQLENFSLQLKISEHQISTLWATLFPILPWMPLLGSKGRRKGSKGNIVRCTVAFAVGLGLVGVGLLFGWTIGCLFSV
ncbi:uncharacterized protein LOC141818766 [Curcuma longa]|uniref:uncharacterized protein LOC141818766 n=1 Tax=Curcuma longa TaxID=136217 RepID=UPI003D9F11D1